MCREKRPACFLCSVHVSGGFLFPVNPVDSFSCLTCELSPVYLGDRCQPVDVT